MTLSNSGTITGTGGVLRLDFRETNINGTLNLTCFNMGIMSANAGTLAISSAGIVNTNGTIEAVNGGNILLYSRKSDVPFCAYYRESGAG